LFAAGRKLPVRTLSDPQRLIFAGIVLAIHMISVSLVLAQGYVLIQSTVNHMQYNVLARMHALRHATRRLAVHAPRNVHIQADIALHRLASRITPRIMLLACRPPLCVQRPRHQFTKTMTDK